MASLTSSPWQAQQTIEEANPQILKKKKKKKKKPIQSRSVHQKPQISTSEITKAKANLKTKKQSNTSPQKLDRSNRSPDSRAHHRPSSEIGPVVVQSTSSLIGDRSHIVEDQSSPGHIATGSLVVFACPLSQIVGHLVPQLLRCSMLPSDPPSRYFSLFSSLNLSLK